MWPRGNRRWSTWPRVVSDVPALETIAQRLERDTHSRREALDRVEKMSRGVQGINLNTGQDFDREFMELLQIVGTEIEWELTDGIPAVRRALEAHDKVDDLKSADQVKRHAPTNLHPDGPRWYEQAPVLSRLLTIYNHLRDFPQSVREQ
jgi:hypothetical protein